jgi:hypothetical protein
MVKVQQIDTSGLSRLLLGIRNALIGQGQSGDLNQLLRNETKQLAMEIGRAPNARQKARAEKSIKRDIGSVFLARPAQTLPQEKQGGGDMVWLEAGPNFLIGASPLSVLSDENIGNAEKSIYYKLLGKFPQAKYTELGKRGVQHVKRINRVVVGRGVIARLFESIKAKVGKGAASFAETASALGESKIPSAVRKHFPTNKNITQLGGLSNVDNPSVTFGSRAKGVGKMAGRVNRAVKVRGKKMAYRLRLIISGYSADNKSRHSIRHHKP